MPNFCKNHPERISKRRCFSCKEAICPDCQILVSHHYFCSFKCHKRFLRKKGLKRATSSTSRAFPWSRSFKILFNGLLLGGLCVSLWILYTVSTRLKALEGNLAKPVSLELHESANGKTGPMNGHGMADLSILSPVKNALVLTNRIDIHGEASPDQIITLIVDGSVKEVTLSKEGVFHFADIAMLRGQNTVTVKALNIEGGITAVETIHFEYSNPTVTYLSRNVTRGNLREARIALTFDGAYMANACEEILDALEQKKLRSTFFLTGRFIEKYPDLARSIVDAGHEVGNHTWSHSHLTSFSEDNQHTTLENVSRDFLQEELKKTADAFETCTGRQLTRLWRAPYGEHNTEIREWAAELGYRHIGWTRGERWSQTMDTMDWVSDTTDPAYYSSQEIAEKILDYGDGLDFGANGAIIIMHLGTLRTTDFPHKKLPEIIDGLREEGYQLVRVSDLLETLP